MSIDYESAERLFAAGEFSEILRLGRRALDSSLRVDSKTNVLLAHSLAFAGDVQRARALALKVSDDPSAEVRSRAALVLALVAEREGDTREALTHYQVAIRSASNPVQLAWAKLHHFRMLLEGHPLDELRAILLDTRKAVTIAATPATSAYLHICVAVLEGQMGRLADVKRHCDIVDSLLEISDNTWLKASNHANRACVALLTRRYSVASRHLSATRELAKRSGNVRILEVAEGTLGHVHLLTGDLPQAKTTFESMLSGSMVHGRVESCAADGLARVHLATNNLIGCAEALHRIKKFAEKSANPFLDYHVRWAGITKARHLLREARADESMSWLASLADATLSLGDKAFNGALRLAMAQALAAQADFAPAAKSLLEAELNGITSSRELQGHFYYGAAKTIGPDPLEPVLRGRALRLWAEQQVPSALLEMEEYKEPNDARKALLAIKGTAAITPDEKSSVANALAATFDLAHSPRLLGAELLGVIRGLDCSPGARLVESRASEPESSPDQLTLPLGIVDGRRLTLVCPAPERPAAAVLLGDVLRIGRAAQAVEQARQEERNRAALWPASPVEEQAGALFLAEEMRTLLATARRLAATNVPVLITGETGTGKEVLARTIHGYSARAARTFLPFNCTATPRDMVDAQLFGHRRGAFTGATEHFPGIIRAAAGGTLLLDEIGEIPLDVQPKLLRFLESGEVHPIGETHPTKVDVRVIAATNADLDTLMAQGRFREDLFYRLNIVRLPIPPLRERRVEIPTLASHYLQKYAAECGKHELRLADETMEYLVLYSWPGNVRRLANEMRRMAALAENGAVLMPEHLSPEIAASRRTIPASQRALEPTEVVVRMDQPLPAATQHLERAMIAYAMARCGGRLEETAALLGLSRKGLYLKRQRLGLEVAADDLEFT